MRSQVVVESMNQTVLKVKQFADKKFLKNLSGILNFSGVSLHEKWSFQLNISSVNVTSTVSC